MKFSLYSLILLGQCTLFTYATDLDNLTLVSGFSTFNGSELDPIVTSDLGDILLTWDLKNVIWNGDGTFTTPGTENLKGEIVFDIRTLNLTGAASGEGYTVHVNFAGVQGIDKTRALVTLNTANSSSEVQQDAIRVQTKSSNVIRVANNGSAGTSTAPTSENTIDFSAPFSITISVQSGGEYHVFVQQNGDMESLVNSMGNTNNANQRGELRAIYLGSSAKDYTFQSMATVQGVSFWNGAASLDQVQALIDATNPIAHVPEPTAITLGILSVSGLSLYRRRHPAGQ